jgi:hypothetical protein
MAVAGFWRLFRSGCLWANIDNAEWIGRQLVEMFLKKCARDVWDARKKGR